jgi:hypothetical protein
MYSFEEDVEAYSTVLDENVNNHNVFRGYAIENQDFTLANDETYSTTVEWKIPDAKIPIKPGDITAIAAVYDLDDTNSEKGTMGNDAQVPRCIQSATPRSTAYDKNNDMPIVTDFVTSFNGEFQIVANLDDEDGVSKAYVLYNTEAQNSTEWSYVEMELAGEELCDDQGVCFAYAQSSATATIDIEDGATLYFMFLLYDGAGVEFGGLGAQGKSEMYNFTITGANNNNAANSLSGGAIGAVIGVCAIIVILIMFKIMNDKKKHKNKSEGTKPDPTLEK